jgi:hypothetical protein
LGKEMMMTETSRNLEEPLVAERWVAGAYTFSGTFLLDGTGLVPSTVCNDLEMCYQSIRQRRVRRWPRGLARYILVPVYCASTFQEETQSLLYGYSRPRRFYVSMKPVLYNSERNRVEAKDAVQNDTLMYYWYLKELFAAGISRAVMHFGHKAELTTDAGDERIQEMLRKRTAQQSTALPRAPSGHSEGAR